MKRTIAVLGGDMRQVCLARLLLEDGLDVVSWGLEQGDGPNPAPLNQALEAGLVLLQKRPGEGGGGPVQGQEELRQARRRRPAGRQAHHRPGHEELPVRSYSKSQKLIETQLLKRRNQL